jgi:DNA-binding NarL/FixJ family response regulator
MLIEQTQLDRAHAHIAAGSALLRAGRPAEARDALRLALDLAHRCGASALEREALTELRAAGGRPRRLLTSGVGALTPSERRVAELAASGSLNREIADALFVTISTVEFHLRRAFRKLGITSRTELGAALEVPGGLQLRLV